jgi:ubiquinone/menaquinone biosynthesis C-methylase UbiE
VTGARVDGALASVLGRVPVPAFRREAKRRAELAYWKNQYTGEGGLRGDHYERFFTTFFGLSRDDYAGRRVLDIGCGPRGSLEWASDAAERVGLDPLADDYRRLVGEDHRMRYVAGTAEAIPFADAHFDFLAAFNSLDHVDDLDRAVAEIGRVAGPGALFLLVTEVGHEPTFTEPQSLGWDVLDRFAGKWEVLDARRYKRVSANMMDSLDAGVIAGPDEARGYLGAKLRRLDGR